MTVSPRLSSVFLFLVFDVAFILTPYWKVFSTPRAAALAFTLSIAVGILWAKSAAPPVRLSVTRRDLAVFALLLCVCLAIDLRSLVADIPWRGDEDFHIMATAPLAERLLPHLTVVALVLAGYVGINVLAEKRTAWVSIASMIALALFGLRLASLFAYDRFDPFRYPYVSRYVAAVPIVISTSVVGGPLEIAYRIVPFVSAVLVGFVVGRQAAKADPVGLLLTGVFVVTMPLLLYYSSILYLELPAALLMLLAALNAQRLLTGDVGDILESPGWLPLVLIGFIKETTLPFLAAFLVCRLAIQIGPCTRASHPWRRILQELRVVAAVAVPIGVYLFYRSYKGIVRVLSVSFENLVDPQVYTTFAWSYVEQLGPVVILCVAGLSLLLVARRYAMVLFLACAYVFDTGLHVVDVKEYAGYSRFNLFVLPLVLVPASVALAQLRARFPRLTYALLVGGIGANLWLSPVNLDGSKRPLWGNYLVDTSEHYYPYKRARQWIRDNGLDQARIRFTGMTYSYYAFRVLEQFPHQDEDVIAQRSDERVSIELALDAARRDRCDVVVYHVIGTVIPAVTQTSGFQVAQVVANQAHTLLIFRKVS